jgi:hypothetical protein
MKAKRSLAWFPLPIQCQTLIADLSDGAFKLLIFLYLNVDRETAQLSFKQTVLARILRKSRRSLAAYLMELQERRICIIRMSANQYAGGTIQIQEAYWPYAITHSTSANAQDRYLQVIQSYLQPRNCIRCRFSASDRQLAQNWFQAGVEPQAIERAIMLACSRKYISWLNGGDSQPIVSLRYFEQILQEVLQEKASPEYWDFLKAQLERIEQKWVSSRSFACANFAQAKADRR